jgi:two-component sensor histidine kinase
MSLKLVKTRDSPALDLIGEANHRIANHLAILGGLLRREGINISRKHQTMTGQEVRLVLEDSAARLETVARVHRQLSNGKKAGSIEVDAYLRGIAEDVVASLSFAGEITLHCECRASCDLSAEKAVALGLIVGELVTNAVKYAHPTGIAGAVSIHTSLLPDGFIVIEVADDGVGLPEGLDPLASDSIGLGMIRALAMKLGATMEFESNGLGLSCKLRMAHANAEPKADWSGRLS